MMSGILVIPNKKDFFEKILDSLKHEKWFHIDKYSDKNFKIARIHLGIYNSEPQPIFNEDKSLCIFMDGKIYGYEEDKDILIEKGHIFSNTNDAEFCLHSYEEYGTDFIKKLNGSFLLVIYDIIKKRLIVANDRYGQRRHYFRFADGEFFLAPECKALLYDTNFKKEINDDAIAEWFAFSHMFGNKTFFKKIEIFPPASIAIWDGQLSIEQYWDFKYRPDNKKTENAFINELTLALKKAIDIRTEDDFEYCIALSGGLDSRLILNGLKEKKRIYAYTFGPAEIDEVKIAKEVTRITKVTHKLMDINYKMILQNAEKTIRLTDGLNTIDNGFALSILDLIKSADVTFDGYALDLTFGGSYLTKDLLKIKTNEDLSEYLYKKRLFSDKELESLFLPEFYNKIKDVPKKSFKNFINTINFNESGNKSDYYFLKVHVKPVYPILVRNYLEISFPTLDNNFIDILLTIPPKLRLNHRIYRKYMKKNLPELSKIPYEKTMVKPSAPLIFWKFGRYCNLLAIIIKKIIWKVSLGKIKLADKKEYVSMNEWFRTNQEWNLFFTNLLLSDTSLIKKYINQSYVKDILNNLREGKGIHYIRDPKRLIFLASFEIFLRLYFSDKS
jgi:asparagine synthase (glutamine-hydrolysing)